MKIYDCKCEGCQAEFQAVLDNPEDQVECPGCHGKEVIMTETEYELGCGGGCGSCGGCGTQAE